MIKTHLHRQTFLVKTTAILVRNAANHYWPWPPWVTWHNRNHPICVAVPKVAKAIRGVHISGAELWLFSPKNFANVPYFIECNAHTSIVRTWISQWFLAKKIFLLFNYNFARINHCKFIYYKGHLKPFLSYLRGIVRREYFSIIFSVKKCALYSIKYGKFSLSLLIKNATFSERVNYLILNWDKPAPT